jgi:23S rRNA (guanosine2251-2'-O)-methyltransferase
VNPIIFLIIDRHDAASQIDFVVPFGGNLLYDFFMKQRAKKPFGKPGSPSGGRDGGRKDHQAPKGGRPAGAAKGRKSAERAESRGPRSAKASKPATERGPRLNIDLFGTHAVAAAWANPARFVHTLYVTENALADFDLKSPAKRPAPTIVAKEDLDRALPPGTVHQGIALSCQALEEMDIDDLIRAGDEQPRSMLVMLDQVTDPHNIGAILRSSCAFGAHGLVLQRKHAPEVTGIMAKTACGALEHVPMAYETNLSRAIEKFQAAGYFVIGLDEHGEKSIGDLPSYDKCVLVMGAEGPGLRRLIKENCDVLARLPMHGPMPSINVSNAAAVALYALSEK